MWQYLFLYIKKSNKIMIFIGEEIFETISEGGNVGNINTYHITTFATEELGRQCSIPSIELNFVYNTEKILQDGFKGTRYCH